MFFQQRRQSHRDGNENFLSETSMEIYANFHRNFPNDLREFPGEYRLFTWIFDEFSLH